MHPKSWGQLLPSKGEDVCGAFLVKWKLARLDHLSFFRLITRSGILPSHITFWLPVHQCVRITTFWMHHLLWQSLFCGLTIVHAQHPKTLHWVFIGCAHIQELGCKDSLYAHEYGVESLLDVREATLGVSQLQVSATLLRDMRMDIWVCRFARFTRVVSSGALGAEIYACNRSFIAYVLLSASYVVLHQHFGFRLAGVVVYVTGTHAFQQHYNTCNDCALLFSLQALCCARNRNKCCNALLRTMLATPKSGANLKRCCALVVMPASVRNVWLSQEWPLGHYASNMFVGNCAEDFASSLIAS